MFVVSLIFLALAIGLGVYLAFDRRMSRSFNAGYISAFDYNLRARSKRHWSKIQLMGKISCLIFFGVVGAYCWAGYVAKQGGYIDDMFLHSTPQLSVFYVMLGVFVLSLLLSAMIAIERYLAIVCLVRPTSELAIFSPIFGLAMGIASSLGSAAIPNGMVSRVVDRAAQRNGYEEELATLLSYMRVEDIGYYKTAFATGSGGHIVLLIALVIVVGVILTHRRYRYFASEIDRLTYPVLSFLFACSLLALGFMLGVKVSPNFLRVATGVVAVFMICPLLSIILIFGFWGRLTQEGTACSGSSSGTSGMMTLRDSRGRYYVGQGSMSSWPHSIRERSGSREYYLGSGGDTYYEVGGGDSISVGSMQHMLW